MPTAAADRKEVLIKIFKDTGLTSKVTSINFQQNSVNANVSFADADAARVMIDHLCFQQIEGQDGKIIEAKQSKSEAIRRIRSIMFRCKDILREEFGEDTRLRVSNGLVEYNGLVLA